MKATGRKNRRERMLQTAMAFGNIQRSFYFALLFAVVTPIVLVTLANGGARRETAPYVIPGVFFSVFCAAFAYFLYHVIRIKAKRYYGVTAGAFFICLLCFLSYFARIQYRQEGRLFFYYAAVLLGAYLIYTTVPGYSLLCVAELLGLLFIMGGFRGEGAALADGVIGMNRLAEVIAVELFAFFLSREGYQSRRKVLLDEQKLKCGMMEAERDPLTGLMNRRGLEHAVSLVWEKCVRNRELAAAMIVDIDHFKQYNDKFGHVEGDACIRRVAQCILETAGAYASVARIGGEEFMIFAKGLQEEELLRLAEGIRYNIEALRIPHATKGTVVTVSIGVDMENLSDDSSFLGLYERADKKLYLAKEEGRNCVKSNYNRGRKYHRIG